MLFYLLFLRTRRLPKDLGFCFCLLKVGVNPILHNQNINKRTWLTLAIIIVMKRDTGSARFPFYMLHHNYEYYIYGKTLQSYLIWMRSTKLNAISLSTRDVHCKCQNQRNVKVESILLAILPSYRDIWGPSTFELRVKQLFS